MVYISGTPFISKDNKSIPQKKKIKGVSQSLATGSIWACTRACSYQGTREAQITCSDWRHLP